MKCLHRILQISFMNAFLVVHIRSEMLKIVIPTKTHFSCLDKPAGFYADFDTRCKIYHTCDEYGNKFTYHCPEETAFRQEALICDHAHLVNCQRNISFSSETVKNKYSNLSCIKGSMDENNCQYSSQLPTEIQSRKTHSVVQRGYTFNLHKVLQNFNKTNITEEKIMNDFHPQTETFKNQQIKSKSNEHFFIASQIFPNKDKLTEHTESNQQNYVNTKTNITLHNFLKLPLQTFSANIQNQQSNTNSNQTAKNRTDFYKVPCINHRNDPYVETLNSIQKSTIIPLTRTSTTVTNVTTELPIYALTLSLKPLIPRELDYDPYYPKFTSTESYYSSSRIPNKLPYVKTILQKSWSNTHIELPSVLPDLRSLEDIVDRRKLFYIPRI